MSTDSQQDRFICPLSHEPISHPTEDGWWCEHSEGDGNGHETVVVLDRKTGGIIMDSGRHASVDIEEVDGDE